ncbi:hypothetical protein HPP92_019284 [Vanilla planifolia]|uniref:J domain-containing protein n=1 Tax=Vanilla planifolia TaxID=51239 RepID=A0A835Q6I6_VANPL|nr:hypothetical protein HPP92_019284 [Vanilla planifolia]
MKITVPLLVRRYFVPLVLFAIGVFFQLVVLPNSFPASHYDVLGLERFATVEKVEDAYSKLSSKWLSSLNLPTPAEFVKIRYAYELLTNGEWKRDYDLFAIDEQRHVIDETIMRHAGESYLKVNLPLLYSNWSGSMDQDLDVLTLENFGSIVGGSKAMLTMVFSFGSHRCATFMNSWTRIGALLDGVANTGAVDVANVQLASFFAERAFNKQPIFRNGLPALIAFPPNCASSNCYIRYNGDLSVDAIIDWLATSVLGLPRILYYSKDSLVQKFFLNSGMHKIKILFFSKTGERAVPFLRQAAKEYSTYASFAMVLWKQEDSSVWWNMFQVDSAPALVIIKDPGVNPIVHYGNLNSSQFFELMEKNKYQELPQLRSTTSMALGCDAEGFSLAGSNVETWYCAILAGRPGQTLNKMRDTMRRIQKTLRDDADANGNKVSVEASAAVAAMKANRLSFAWLDGGVQKDYCLFYLHKLENIYETCGPSDYDSKDVPRLFIVRYKRNSVEHELRPKKKPNSFWSAFDKENSNLASQIVAVYNGTVDIQEVIQWISWIVEDGDKSTMHPYFIGAAPALIPEESTTFISRSTQSIFSTGNGLKDRVLDICTSLYEFRRDPRIGPMFFLASCISFGAIWVRSSSQPAHSAEVEDGTTATRNQTNRRRKTSTTDIPPSITDAVPSDAHQLLPSDSDSE